MSGNTDFFPLERNRYFYGKLLTVRDFEIEQKYMRNSSQLVRRLVYGAGVVCGLGVSASDDSTLLISTHQARDLEAIIDPIIILDRRDVLLNATLDEIAGKLYFDYSSDLNPAALYQEMVPGGNIQVVPNTMGLESKVNIEALFNAVLLHKAVIKDMFNK